VETVIETVIVVEAARIPTGAADPLLRRPALAVGTEVGETVARAANAANSASPKRLKPR
jgi:hypothetical protein